ncbi:hypothetical protein DDP54_02355 [Cellulomonas sp. WB94]|uniref:helix-turn-helix domain-containing protein n=1 Tax=Cellulomonas sp. WB94 TaxID=2173174 RepID=UPI000D564C39|nr:helix-turn-helix domain-containing protein [Cellulomonas sp. WB94]PVU82041.1 hypothetical protein DDP54_02355 [Cellulomonas sp. WB94]
MTQVTTAEAAERLGISQRQVQRVIARGDLPANRTAGDAWVVDALALNALVRARPDRGRPWAPGTSWAALWRLSGLEVDWLDRRSASRLAGRLASLDAEGLLHAARRRATVHRFRASDSFLESLAAAVVRTGTSAMTPSTFGLARDTAHVDGYCDEGALAGLVREFHLVEDFRGNVTLRTAPLRSLPIGDRDEMPRAVVAADLAESLEVRERSAGLRVLEGLLQ